MMSGLSSSKISKIYYDYTDTEFYSKYEFHKLSMLRYSFVCIVVLENVLTLNFHNMLYVFRIPFKLFVILFSASLY